MSSHALIPVFPGRPTHVKDGPWTVVLAVHDYAYLRTKAAYRRMMRDAHPDRGGTTERLQRVTREWGAFQHRERTWYWRVGRLMPPDWKRAPEPPRWSRVTQRPVRRQPLSGPGRNRGRLMQMDARDVLQMIVDKAALAGATPFTPEIELARRLLAEPAPKVAVLVVENRDWTRTVTVHRTAADALAALREAHDVPAEVPDAAVVPLLRKGHTIDDAEIVTADLP